MQKSVSVTRPTWTAMHVNIPTTAQHICIYLPDRERGRTKMRITKARETGRERDRDRDRDMYSQING